MMDEKDAIALMAGTIESTETAENGKASIDKETFDAMMNAIDSKLSTLNKSVTNLTDGLSDIDKRVNRLEYKGRCANTKDLQSLMYKVEQMEAALNMSKKYRKRRAKVSKN